MELYGLQVLFIYFKFGHLLILEMTEYLVCTCDLSHKLIIISFSQIHDICPHLFQTFLLVGFTLLHGFYYHLHVSSYQIYICDSDHPLSSRHALPPFYETFCTLLYCKYFIYTYI